MAWFNVFKKSSDEVPMVADEFDALAVVVRFASVKERSFAFYQKHRLVVDAALEFITTLRGESRELGLMLSGSGQPIAKTALTLRDRVQHLALSNLAQSMVDAGAFELAPRFEPMLADTSRPTYLEECRWVVKSCAERQDAPVAAGLAL